MAHGLRSSRGTWVLAGTAGGNDESIHGDIKLSNKEGTPYFTLELT